MKELELAIAWRYLRSRRGSRLLSLISVIAIGGVLVVPALQLAQRGVGQALLCGTGHGRLLGRAEGIAPLGQLVLEQALLAAPGVQRGPLQTVAFIQSQQPLNRGPLAGGYVVGQGCRMRQPCPVSA